jgi:hypothetical protein
MSASQIAEYNRIQSEYAVYTAGNEIQKISDELKPFRPPTAPASDIEVERKAILSLQGNKLLFIQLVLVLVILSMVTYIVVPSTYSHLIVFLLLCVGVALGFFLRK